MLICIVREAPSANKIIVDGPQQSRKQLARTDESAVEFLLNAIMPPLLLAELCELDQSCDLSLQNGKICPTGTGVKIYLSIGTLSCAKAILGFYEIDVPTHHLILPESSPPLYAATDVRRALVLKSLALVTAACWQKARRAPAAAPLRTAGLHPD
jgi:hypothetical protein